MRATFILAAGLLIAGPVHADEALFDSEAIAADELSASRGGTETSTTLTNGSALSGSNTGDIDVSNGAIKSSGGIAPAQVNGNHGITAVIQNTGDLVNISNATSINVYMR